MPSFRVDMTYERTVTFFVEAEDKVDVEGFLESHPEWQPGDVPGLIDVVSDEREVEFRVSTEDKVTANFRVTEDLELEEKDQ